MTSIGWTLWLDPSKQLAAIHIATIPHLDIKNLLRHMELTQLELVAIDQFLPALGMGFKTTVFLSFSPDAI